MSASILFIKKYFVNFLVLLLAFNSFGQILTENKPQNALLWQVSGGDLKHPSYVFGTIHLIGKDDFHLSESTREALSKSEQVTFEIDLEDMNDISKMMPLLMNAFMKNDTTLSDLLSAEEYKLVEQHFQSLGLPLFFLQKIKPMFLSAFGSEGMMGTENDPESVVSYEFELLKIAQGEQKEIQGLETAEFQMSMFDSIPYKVQAQMLLETIKSGDGDQQEFQRMVDLYKNQDIEGMQDLMKEDKDGIGNYEEMLLVNRNKNWIPIMEKMMIDKPTFFAVGAGHLGGQWGVIKILQSKGYQLEPITW